MIKEISYVTGNNGKYEMVRKYLATHSSIALNQVNIEKSQRYVDFYCSYNTQEYEAESTAKK